jgi:DNA-binding transcriptional regulator LsrR (DeoR family)
MTKDEERKLVRIAEMYYMENRTQSEISKELHIHRSTISRLLKMSREKGIVKISIDPLAAGTFSYEEALIDKYHLKDAAVVSSDSDDHDLTLALLGKAGNDCLKKILKDDMILGFSWGEAMHAFAVALEDMQKSNILCVPIVGGPSGRSSSEYHVNTVTYEASRHLHGRALLIDAPALPDTLELKKALMNDSFNQSLVDFWHRLDIAIFGIGSPAIKSSDRWKSFYGQNVFCFVKENEVAGDVASRFYDENGRHITSELDDRIIGIDPADLERVPYRIGIAESRAKVKAIRGALRGGYVNILVTTRETAAELLEEQEA